MRLDVSSILTLLVVVVLLFAALHDIAFRTVPNWVSATLMTAAVVLRLLDHRLPAGLACGLAVFTLAAICWRRGWVGGGDVKLLGATAVLVAPNLVLGYIAVVAFMGGALAVLYLLLAQLVPALRARRPASLLRRIVIVECRRIRRRASVPYATAISVAALLVLARG